MTSELFHDGNNEKANGVKFFISGDSKIDKAPSARSKLDRSAGVTNSQCQYSVPCCFDVRRIMLGTWGKSPLSGSNDRVVLSSRLCYYSGGLGWSGSLGAKASAYDRRSRTMDLNPFYALDKFSV